MFTQPLSQFIRFSSILLPPTYYLSVSVCNFARSDAVQCQDPLSAPATALTIQHEKMRVSEALAARDAVVHHLELACRSVREKAVTIEELRIEKEDLERRLEELSGGAIRGGAGGGGSNRRGHSNDARDSEADGHIIEGGNESASAESEVERLKGVIASLQLEVHQLNSQVAQKSGLTPTDRQQSPPTREKGQAGLSMVRPSGGEILMASLAVAAASVSVVLILLPTVWVSHLPLHSHFCPHKALQYMLCYSCTSSCSGRFPSSWDSG